MSSQVPAMLLEPRWFLLFFVLMWFVVTGLLAHLGGWASLAASFRAEGRIEGERFRFASGSMGLRFLPVNYGNCLFITVGAKGLHVSLFLPFRFESPPLFVPWSRVESVTERRFLLFFKFADVSIRDHWPRISLRGASGRKAKEAYDAAQAGRVR